MDEILIKYSTTYLTILDIPFKILINLNGPEDTHVILKSDLRGEESVVIFNMATPNCRKVHTMPSKRKDDPFVDFNINDFKIKSDE